MTSKQSPLKKRTPKQPDRLHVSMDAKKKSYGVSSSSSSAEGKFVLPLRVVVFPQECGIDGCKFVFHTPNATGPHINNRHKGKKNIFKGKMHRIVKRVAHMEVKKPSLTEDDEETSLAEDDEKKEKGDEEKQASAVEEDEQSDDESVEESSIESVQPDVIARNIEERMVAAPPANKKAKLEPVVAKDDLFRMILTNHKEKQRLDAEQKALESKEKELLLHLGAMELRRLIEQQQQGQ